MTLYSTDGRHGKNHIHTLRRISEPPYRWLCINCNARLERKSGIVLKPDPKPPTKEAA
jgi:hypothetical protein